jgi:hypothetical protein
MFDLNEIIPSASGFTVVDARGINDHGQVVANGRDATGNYRALLLTPSSRPALPLIWGAKVQVTPKSGTPWEGFLVASDGANIYTQTDLSIDSSSAVTITGTGTGLSTIASITVVPDPKPEKPDRATFGFNKYCCTASSAALELAVANPPPVGGAVACYQDGVGWNFVNTADGTYNTIGNQIPPLPASTPLYAVPRPVAPGDWVLPPNRTVAGDAAIKAAIAAQAASLSIPPMILFGKLWGDTKGSLSVGWNQWGFISSRPAPGVPGSAKPVVIKDPDTAERTVVTYDGTNPASNTADGITYEFDVP